ncbi:MAG: hypothetical protein JO267_07860 [Alphaproteobacteria bacterium]|nr:hypothetical protein [Alphaproteobacteria bacterium]
MPDKEREKTGKAGTEGLPEAARKPGKRRANSGSFQKGQSGNPKGRRRGSGTKGFRAGMRAAAALLDQNAEALAEKALELALAGDPIAVRFCLGRILGSLRGQAVELPLPAIVQRGDVAGALAAIAAAVAAGRVTPDEALVLAQMLGCFPRLPADPPPGAADPETEALAVLARRLDELAAAGAG